MLRRKGAFRLDLLDGTEPGLVALGHAHLLRASEQRDLADLLQVHLHRIEAGGRGQVPSVPRPRRAGRADRLGRRFLRDYVGDGWSDRLDDASRVIVPTAGPPLVLQLEFLDDLIDYLDAVGLQRRVNRRQLRRRRLEIR